MRTHRYRGFSKKLNKWVFGNLISNPRPFIVGEVVESCEEYIAFEFWEPVDPEEEYIAFEFWEPVDPESVGQLTGLKDKNGVEIYEGDIVRKNYGPNEFDDNDSIEDGVVGWVDGGFWFVKKDHTYYNLKSSPLEIIGNIFSNPELLKEGAFNSVPLCGLTKKVNPGSEVIEYQRCGVVNEFGDCEDFKKKEKKSWRRI